MKRTELNNQKALGLLTAFAGSNLTNFFRRFFAESGKSKFKQFMACCMLFVFTCSCTRCEPCENNESFGSKPLPEGVTGQELNDMFLKHEGVPHGVPEGYGWKYVPVIDVGAKMPSDFKKIIQCKPGFIMGKTMNIDRIIGFFAF